MGKVNQTVRGMSCLRRSSRKVVRGLLGESFETPALDGVV